MRIKNRNSFNIDDFEPTPGRLAGFVRGPAPAVDIGFADYLDQRQSIKDSSLHSQLRKDISEHLWTVKGNTIE